MSYRQTPQEILRPASGLYILATTLAGVLLNLLPWQGLALTVRPDFAALLVLYWCINQPRRMGIGRPWLIGLLMDIADAALFGQHAFAYSVAAFGALFLHRRIQRFSPWQQALHVAILLVLIQALMLMVRLLAGADFPGWSLFVSVLVGALLWPGLSLVLQIPLRLPPPSEGKVSG